MKNPVTTIKALGDAVHNSTQVRVKNGVIAEALKGLGVEISGAVRGATEVPAGVKVEDLIAALATDNPVIASWIQQQTAAPTHNSTLASPLAALPGDEASSVAVDVQPVGDAEIFFNEGLVRRPAAVVASELSLTTAEVLVYGEVQVGDAASLVDPELVRKNLEATLAAEKIPASERPTGTSVFTKNIALAAMVTSDHTRVGTKSKRTLREITEVAISLQKLSVAIHNGSPFRPEPVAVSRIAGQAELVRTAPGMVPPGADTVFYEYESPLRKGWMVRIRTQKYLELMLQPGSSFPLYGPQHLEELVGELATTDLVADRCAACGKHMDPLLRDKVMKVLNGQYYLRDNKGRALSNLSKLGYPTDRVGEISFKRNHEACNVLLKRMQVVMNEMLAKDFNDPAVVIEFLDRIEQEVGGVMEELRLRNSRNQRITRREILIHARDIVKQLAVAA